MQSLAENQPFVDGNKRIAWLSGKAFLRFHGLAIHATAEEGVELFASRIANGMTVPELAQWIDRHVSSLFVSEDDSTEA
jgi:death-on-curing protein